MPSQILHANNRPTLSAVVMTTALLVCACLAALGFSQKLDATSLTNTQKERIGYGVAPLRNEITFYPNSVAALNGGWYTDYRYQANPPQPGGIKYVQMLSVGGDFGNWDALSNTIAANPGSTFFIGNEPDRQEICTPPDYARRYHALYTFIKAEDPTAQVAAGGVVQATPLRLQYLTDVLAEYQALYGEPLPADLWHIHEQILNEDFNGSHGCSVPVQWVNWVLTRTVGSEVISYNMHSRLPLYCTDPQANIEYCTYDIYAQPAEGQTLVETGELIEMHQSADVELFKQHVIRMRQWMKNNGYQEKPLVISEYGVLYPANYLVPRTDQTVIDFINGTFHFLLSATDEDLGCPDDGYRLVQRWNWYSMNDHPDPFCCGGYNGPLVYWDHDELRNFGHAFIEFTSNGEPQNISASQTTNVATPNALHEITATYADPDGVGELDEVYLLINDHESERNGAVALRYVRGSNKLYIRSADGSEWLPSGGLTPGSGAPYGTTYGNIHPADCTVQTAGNELTLTWALSFKKAIGTGTQNVYLKAQDWSGMFDGWDPLAQVTITNPDLIAALKMTGGAPWLYLYDAPVEFWSPVSIQGSNSSPIPGGDVKFMFGLDHDGDGNSEIAAVKTIGGVPYLYIYSQPTSWDAPCSAVAANYIPIPAGDIRFMFGLDHDGDGVEEIAAVKVLDGTPYLYIYTSPGGWWTSVNRVASNFLPIPGGDVKFMFSVDHDGDGTDEIACVKLLPDGHRYLYIYSAPSGMWTPVSTVASNFLPIPGGDVRHIFSVDYDGDGTDEIAAVKILDGIKYLYIYTSPSGMWTAVNRVAANYMPIVSGDLVDIFGLKRAP